MRKVALAITGLLLALGGGAHGKTVPAQGPSPWCEGHLDAPTGNTVTASAGVERGESAVSVFACFEVMAGGSRPTSAEVLRVWLDPDRALGAECVSHRDARVTRHCYKRADAPAEDERKQADDERRNRAEELGSEASKGTPSDAPEANPPCEGACIDADEVDVITTVPEAVVEEVGKNVPGR